MNFAKFRPIKSAKSFSENPPALFTGKFTTYRVIDGGVAIPVRYMKVEKRLVSRYIYKRERERLYTVAAAGAEAGGSVHFSWKGKGSLFKYSTGLCVQ